MSEFQSDKRIFLVEDDDNFQKIALILLQKIGFQNIETANNYETAIDKFTTYQPDIVLMDIDLGGVKTGIDLAYDFNKIRRTPLVYITSNYNEESYEDAKKTGPIGFINKELSVLKLRQAIELGLNQRTEELPMAYTKEEVNSGLITNEIFAKVGNVLKKIPLEDIDWFGVDGKYSYAKSGNKQFPLSIPLKNLANKIHEDEFIRVHQSYIVNVKKIESIDIIKNTLHTNAGELPIGRSFKKNLLNRIQSF